MSITKMSLTEIVKKQYQFKLKANIDSFSSLVFVQALAILFSSFAGSSSLGGGGSWFHYNASYYSADLIIAFTMIWALTTAITITTKPYRNHDVTFVFNRLSSSLSNALFLFTASLLGAALSFLAGNLLKFIVYMRLGEQLYTYSTGFGDMLIGFCVAFLYILLFSAIGYVVGSLVQLNKLFAWLLPASVIGPWFILGFPLIPGLVEFYGMEKTFSIFVIKVIATVAILFAVSFSAWNRLEVRK